MIRQSLRKLNDQIRQFEPYDKWYRGVRGYGAPKKRSPGQIAGDKYHALFHEVRVNSKQALFDCFWGRSVGGNPYAVYQQMRNDARFDGFTFIWVCDDVSSAPAEMRNDPSVRFVAYQSEEFVNGLLSSKYLVANTNLPPYFLTKPDQVYVNVWHGTPLKCISKDADRRKIAIANTQRNYFQSDLILSYSPVATERTVGSADALDAMPRVHEIGTPRIDVTLNAKREDVRKKLNVTGDRPVLLYAPTWRGSFGRVNTGLQRQIDEIARFEKEYSEDYEVFISAHHLTALGLKEQNISIRSVPKDIPINEVLAGVDVLVSDYSSIMVDYLVLDRPIILYCYDYEAYMSHQGFYDDLTEFPGTLCLDEHALQSALLEPRKPSSFETHQQFYDMLCPLEDGSASERAVELIANFSHEEKRSDHRKRILIYPGGMKSNGVTSSVIELSHALDYEKYDLTLIFTGAVVDKDPQIQRNIARLSPHCRTTFRAEHTRYSPEEKRAYDYYRKNACYETDTDEQLVRRVFERETKRIFGRQSFDVAIDFSGYSPFWTLAILNSSARRTLIYQHADMHGEAYNANAARSFPELESVFELYKHFDGVVSVSPEIAVVNNEKLSKYYRPGTEVMAARNLISGERILKGAQAPVGFVSAHAAAIRAEKDTYLFCCVARLSPEKNHALLLEAFAKVVEQMPRAGLLIIGSGKLKAELEAYAAVLGVADNVCFMGQMRNPFPVMKMCDCKVLTSTYEGQGLVLMEAMTLGLHCIATDSPAIRGVLGDGLGDIVPSRADDLAEAMLKAVENADQPRKAFDWKGYAKTAMDDFENCINMPE